jgi:glycosyltransferase involved in cell wall biosynthesis
MLTEALSKQRRIDRVYRGLEAFWNGSTDADIVHIQWPENLFKWREPSVSDLDALEETLTRWKARAPLLVTVHNRYPHYRNTPIFERLYRLVYRCADGMIHMGRVSLVETLDTNPALNATPQTVIPLGDYTCFPNVVTKAEARHSMGLRHDQFTALFFGSLRDAEETRLLLTGFRGTRIRHKHLLIAGRIALSRNPFVWAARGANLLLNPAISLRPGVIPDDRVQYYTNAADVVVIPRVQILNSSSVALGFTFGKVVVGPNTGVVGEILLETGNPTFVPQDPLSLATALEQAQALSAQGKGEQNLEYARRNWSWDDIAAQHVDFYERVRAHYNEDVTDSARRDVHSRAGYRSGEPKIGGDGWRGRESAR